MEDKLSQQDYQFCYKLHQQIRKMPTLNDNQRQKVIDYIAKKSKKYSTSFSIVKSDPSYLIYEFKLNDKTNYVVFDRFGNVPPRIVPSGIIAIN